jgi:hypothetical protein
VTALAPSARAPLSLHRPAGPGEALPAEPEVALDPGSWRRAALTGLLLGALALAPVTALALLIAAGPFHTALGSLG